MNNYIDIWFSLYQIVFLLGLFSVLVLGCLRKGEMTIVVFVGTVLSGIILDSSLNYHIRTKLASELSDYSFVIESNEDFDESKLLDALKNKNYVTINRTKPLTKNKVRIVVNNGEVELLIAEDSKNDNTFWVYYPKYRYSRANAIGKIRIR
ncbi:hypothetical protein [Vibrio coralliilyticus]|uniref:hypothetical protein n=1 Tax=Vibrio coralliilyticus TaxID=190893 RepID=UPI00148B72B9|nr:hypothetical protein [Vibrio coralliilyticus]NOI28027.1 hypothetical protein [Vibrio coralliilyticus]NOI49512.1 hypothetical protein [Vibrio coralliilyticus]